MSETNDSRQTVLGAANWLTLDELRLANMDAGKYWFSASTERFFGTTYPDETIYGGTWFIYMNSMVHSDGTVWMPIKVAHAWPDAAIYGDAAGPDDELGSINEAKELCLQLEAGRRRCDCARCSWERVKREEVS